MRGSTCFGSLPAHHHERTIALGASGFTVGAWRLERCWSWSARPRPTALLPPRSYGKPEAAAAVDRLLLMGIRMTETCSAVSKRQTINL